MLKDQWKCKNSILAVKIMIRFYRILQKETQMLIVICITGYNVYVMFIIKRNHYMRCNIRSSTLQFFMRFCSYKHRVICVVYIYSLLIMIHLDEIKYFYKTQYIKIKTHHYHWRLVLIYCVDMVCDISVGTVVCNYVL